MGLFCGEGGLIFSPERGEVGPAGGGRVGCVGLHRSSNSRRVCCQPAVLGNCGILGSWGFVVGVSVAMEMCCACLHRSWMESCTDVLCVSSSVVDGKLY